MKKKKHHHHNEHKAATELRECCADAYDEMHSHSPKAALAFLALSRVVPKIATANPGWSGGSLTRSRFHREKGMH